MLNRTFALSVGFVALTLAACSGGTATTGAVAIRCADAQSFCLVRCDLGCGGSGCSVTEVAENQRLQFVFNQALDRASVTVASFSLRTATGEAPVGDIVVDGSTVTFAPSVSVTNGISSFGFRRNESYVITLAGGPQGIRSAAGNTMASDLTCTVVATRGIIDLDNAPPAATLISPTTLTAAPLDSVIAVRFSEVVDTTGFLAPVGPSTPIHYVLRQTRPVIGSSDRVCALDSAAIQINGIPQIATETIDGRRVTTITLRPQIPLPSQACVEVTVTSDVRDLAGRGASETTFRFLTESGVVRDVSLAEDFASETRMDLTVSGGRWAAGAHPALVGGDGVLGSFNPATGQVLGNNVYVWSTDGMTIPSTQTLSGVTEVVPNGEFFFTDFSVPAGATIRFTGTHPVLIHVRGKADIQGRIECNGQAVSNDYRPFAPPQTLAGWRVPNPSSSNASVPGQPGSAGGPGGAAGGRGGDRCTGGGVVTPAHDGQSGGDLVLPAGHAYAAQAVGTGGRGSPIFPSHGIAIAPTMTFGMGSGGLYNGNFTWGGSGGGFSQVGGVSQSLPGTGVSHLTLPPTPPAGGSALNLFPIPAGTSSLRHFLIGGSGGGGGGSQPFYELNLPTTPQFVNDAYKAGAGGSGGGGALLIRAGGDLVMGVGGTIEAKGGDGAILVGDNPTTTASVPDPLNAAASFGLPAPGGGGSGGSLLLQAHRGITIAGVLNTSGGGGSRAGGTTMQPGDSQIDVRAGAGSPGFYRLESLGSIAASNPANVPANNVAQSQGTLQDRDPVTGCRSTWRSTGFLFPPQWLRYVLEVDSNGDGTVDQIYSDDSSVPNSLGIANDPLGPVRVRFQGAPVDASDQPDLTRLGPWRSVIADPQGGGVAGDGATGFRFELLFNNAQFPDAVVKRLTVFVRG